jgi:hypothetical protein
MAEESVAHLTTNTVPKAYPLPPLHPIGDFALINFIEKGIRKFRYYEDWAKKSGVKRAFIEIALCDDGQLTWHETVTSDAFWTGTWWYSSLFGFSPVIQHRALCIRIIAFQFPKVLPAQVREFLVKLGIFQSQALVAPEVLESVVGEEISAEEWKTVWGNGGVVLSKMSSN